MSDHQRSLAEPAFAGDDGRAYPALAEALGDDTAVISVLPDVRVFVPIVAVLGECPPPRGTSFAAGGAPTTDKNADMSAVFMTGADGRKALLTFSSVAALEAWNPVARPVPVWGREAARAALAEGASALLLDVGSPQFAVIELQREA